MKELLTDPSAWSAIAGNYDQAAKRLLTPFSREAIRWIEIGASDDVLDLACGPGTTTVLAAPLARSVQAVDFAPEMVEACKRNTAALENVSAATGNGQALTFGDASFTAAFSMFGLMFFPDPAVGLRELHRVVAPGGRIVISSWPPMQESPMMLPLGEALMSAIPPTPDRQAPEGFAFETTELLTAALTEAGFVDVQARRFVVDQPVESPDAYWDESRGNLFVNYIREQAGDAWPAIEDKVREHLREALANTTSLPMPALLARGTRPGG